MERKNRTATTSTNVSLTHRKHHQPSFIDVSLAKSRTDIRSIKSSSKSDDNEKQKTPTQYVKFSSMCVVSYEKAKQFNYMGVERYLQMIQQERWFVAYRQTRKSFNAWMEQPAATATGRSSFFNGAVRRPRNSEKKSCMNFALSTSYTKIISKHLPPPNINIRIGLWWPVK